MTQVTMTRLMLGSLGFFAFLPTAWACNFWEECFYTSDNPIAQVGETIVSKGAEYVSDPGKIATDLEKAGKVATGCVANAQSCADKVTKNLSEAATNFTMDMLQCAQNPDSCMNQCVFAAPSARISNITRSGSTVEVTIAQDDKAPGLFFVGWCAGENCRNISSRNTFIRHTTGPGTYTFRLNNVPNQPIAVGVARVDAPIYKVTPGTKSNLNKFTPSGFRVAPCSGKGISKWMDVRGIR